MKRNIRVQVRTGMMLALWVSIGLLPLNLIRANDNIPLGTTNNYRYTFKKDTTGQAVEEPTDNNRVLENGSEKIKSTTSDCQKEGCNIYAEIDKSEQMMYVYVSGELQHSFPVSTGRAGHSTPNLDLRPSGPLYEKYRSKKYPEGDYQGMGNMPYAVFLRGGYAIHGTTPGSIPKLGKPASHGCIRLHPEDAKVFFDLVNSIGLENTWVTVRP